MKPVLSFEKVGQGPALVLLHGWGLNSAVWNQVIDDLANSFTVYTIDLPGFGHNSDADVDASIAEWANAVATVVDEPAIWLGWSLGGLVATQVAIDFPQNILGLISVASSPKFIESDRWSGIKPNVMNMFIEQLSEDFSLTLERFLAIQAMGSDSAKSDISALKKVIKERSMPKESSLHDGLQLLNSVDLRGFLSSINIPVLCLYGKLDSLVPKRVIPLVDDLFNNSQVYIFNKASHAPFISHSQEFIGVVKEFGLSLNR